MQVEETTQSTPLPPTRAGFVRGLPLSMPVEEVIERGREAGIKLQPSDIHAARYYMRQQSPATANVPQQLMLGGTFATKRDEPKALETTGVVEKVAAGSDSESDDDDFEDEDAPAPMAPRRRKIVTSKAIFEARAKENAAREQAEKEAKAAKEQSLALHDRLQARLANATFRASAKEKRREERRVEKEQKRAARQAERLAARENAREVVREERQTQRQIALAKQERAARQERLQKATIGKALLDADSVKSRNKRSQSTAVLEEQVRLISLRLGTQRVRELLDQIETVARQA